MAINPDLIETKKIPQLPDLALELTNFFAHSGANGIAGKATINQLVAIIQANVPSLDSSPFVANTGSPLPNPISKPTAITFVGVGTFSQTTGSSVVTTAALNVLFWASNLTTGTWSIGVAIPIDLTGYATKEDISIFVPGVVVVGKNKFNKAIPPTQSDKAYSPTTGIIGTSVGNNASEKIPVKQSQAYKPSQTISLAFFDMSGVFISGLGSAASFTTPSNCYFVGVNVPTANLNTFQIEEGSVGTAYEPYVATKKIPSDKIDNLSAAVNPLLAPYLKNTDLLAPGKNLFDKSTATDGFFVSATTGLLVSSATLSASDYILITPNTAYYDPVLSQRAYYDINKVYISGVAGPGGGGSFTVPNNINIAYVRLTIITANKNSYQFEAGTVATSYEPFRITVKPSLLPIPANQYWLQKSYQPLYNLHKDLTPFFLSFIQKLGNLQTPQYKPISINCFGDSLMAYINTSSIGTIDITKSFPCATSNNNIFSTIWKQLKRLLPDFLRWDAVGAFVETGTFASYVGRVLNSSWDDNGDREGDTRYSNTASASVAFNIGTKYRLFNFIDRTTPSGKASNIVSIAQGNGYVEVLQNGDWGANVWVEANGYSFSQLQIANTSLQIGNTEYQRRIYFRKTSAHLTSSIDVTITSDATTDMFCYWGVELIERNNYIQIYNSARGAHTIQLITPYVQTDIWNKNPDFIFWEVPLLNNFGNTSFEFSLNAVQDIVFGDRVGFTNTYNFKTKTNNFVDCQLVCYLPSFRQSYYNSDGTYKIAQNNWTYRDIYDKIKSYLISRSIAVIDMELIYRQQVNKNPDFNGNIYNAMAGGTITGIQLTNDGTHPNDNGVKLWEEQTYLFD